MKKHYHSWIPVLLAALFGAVLFLPSGCGNSSNDNDGIIPDTLKVATVYGPVSFFEYRDTIMGYDYEIMEDVAQRHSVVVDWVIANTIEEAVAMVDSGQVALVAAQIPCNKDFKKKIIPCGPTRMVEHVVVQPKGDTLVVSLDQLKGETVYVEKDSKSEEALEKANKKIGGDIKIRPVDADSLATEDLLASVAKGDIKMAVVDSETARYNQTYYPDLMITLAISEPETTRWGVARNQKKLAKIIDEWTSGKEPMENQNEILKKYFESQKNFPVAGASYDRKFINGYASPFDHLFKKHTENSNWDWRMLAAQAYTESRFDSTARSWAGAQGVMQIMPGTARDFGLKKGEMENADRSIETAVKILNAYDAIMAQKIKDPEERKKFTLAAYNAGPGHVIDAINLARKYGYDDQVWDDNVEKAMLMKMNKKYYRDPVVKHGYSRGRETVDYVERIYAYYDDAVEKIPFAG